MEIYNYNIKTFIQKAFVALKHSLCPCKGTAFVNAIQMQYIQLLFITCSRSTADVTLSARSVGNSGSTAVSFTRWEGLPSPSELAEIPLPPGGG